ncbi:hypothetical protein BC834DRAFT_543791 [Gloeopeniophorella convolvens]|nr:hypothetical protein BC834DRAFT_543791 [Gloeopeniophorella convolvens]
MAAFTIKSYSTLKPGQLLDTSVLLARKYNQLAGPVNGSIPFLMSDVTTSRPSTSAVWVNTLSFMSLMLSIICTLVTTLLQQWARRYLQMMTQVFAIRSCANQGASAEGTEKFGLSATVGALSTPLYIPVLPFFIGFVNFFISGINHTSHTVTLSMTVSCVSFYIGFARMPILAVNSPYYTPFSTSAWFTSYASLMAIISPTSYVVGQVSRSTG